MDPLSNAFLETIAGAGAGSGAGASVGPGTAAPNPLEAFGQKLGKVVGNLRAPAQVAPKFGGGVSGMQLPFKAGIGDLLSGALQRAGAGSPMPSLGMLLRQAGR